MILISIGRIDLGNNFDMYHFSDALTEKQIDRIYAKDWDSDSDIRLLAKGNYGRIAINTCGSDLTDFIRGNQWSITANYAING